MLLYAATLYTPMSLDVSCVQVSSATINSTCPFGVSTLSFSIVGETSVVGNLVNIALVLDGSGSVGNADFLTEKDFAKDVNAAFAGRNLFANGGTASYVQFSDYVNPANTGTFASLEDFNNFVDADTFRGGNTDIDAGISEARKLLNAAPPSSAAFMFVITDGISSIGSEANDSRADGITLFAVGVGPSVDEDILRKVAGSEDRVFRVGAFDELEAELDDILGSDGASTIPCPATNVSVIVEYGAPVVPPISFPGATLADDTVTVTFAVSDLEDNLTDFTVMLDTCDATDPVDPVVSMTYNDDHGNSPDLTPVLEVGNDNFPPAKSPPKSGPGTCSNGVIGVEGCGLCCPLECDKCACSGCKTRARKTGLTADDCCPDRIRKSGINCEDVGSAPCKIKKPTCSRRKDKSGKR